MGVDRAFPYVSTDEDESTISGSDPTVCGITNRTNFRRDGTPAVDLLTMRQMKIDGEDVLRGGQPKICHRTTAAPQ